MNKLAFVCVRIGQEDRLTPIAACFTETRPLLTETLFLCSLRPVDKFPKMVHKITLSWLLGVWQLVVGRVAIVGARENLAGVERGLVGVFVCLLACVDQAQASIEFRHAVLKSPRG